MQSANDNLKSNSLLVQGNSGWAGVIGSPIHHSKSPMIHGYWLQEYNISGTYIPIPCPVDKVSGLLDHLEQVYEEEGVGCRGLNVTIPHKETVFRYLSDRIFQGKTGCLSEQARLMGAVNTLSRLEDGSWYGDNSDGFGFIENIRQAAPKYELEGKNCLIIGAGGAARALIISLVQQNVAKIYIANRTSAKAEALKSDLCQKNPSLEKLLWCHSWDKLETLFKEINFCVNATSLGMSGQADLKLDLSYLPKSALVTDIVYTPLKTALLHDAEKQNLLYVDGLGMLLHQARCGFNRWFGIDPHVTPALRQFILSRL